MQKIEEDASRRNTISCLWNGGTNIVKMFMLPKMICKFNTTAIKLLKIFSPTEIDEITLNFAWDHKRLSIIQSMLHREQS